MISLFPDVKYTSGMMKESYVNYLSLIDAVFPDGISKVKLEENILYELRTVCDRTSPDYMQCLNYKDDSTCEQYQVFLKSTCFRIKHAIEEITQHSKRYQACKKVQIWAGKNEGIPVPVDLTFLNTSIALQSFMDDLMQLIEKEITELEKLINSPNQKEIETKVGGRVRSKYNPFNCLFACRTSSKVDKNSEASRSGLEDGSSDDEIIIRLTAAKQSLLSEKGALIAGTKENYLEEPFSPEGIKQSFTEVNKIVKSMSGLSCHGGALCKYLELVNGNNLFKSWDEALVESDESCNYYYEK